MVSLSVSIICQDEQETLPYTLHCIHRALTPFLAEVVIVDGGSQDETVDIIEDWRSRLPIILLHHPFDNSVAQKNRGHKKCTGDWILSMDADHSFTGNMHDIFKHHYAKLDEHEAWDFLCIFPVIDMHHTYRQCLERPLPTTELWKNGHLLVGDFHEQLDTQDRHTWEGVYIFDHGLLQSEAALRHRGERWQPYAEMMKNRGIHPGGPNRYFQAEQKARKDAVQLPQDILNRIIPRGTQMCKRIDEWRNLGRPGPIPPWWLWGAGRPENVYGPKYHHDFGVVNRNSGAAAKRLNFIRDTFGDIESLIDIGCSSGNLVEACLKANIDALGVDMDPSILLPEIRSVPPEFLQIHDMREPYYPPKKFDVCACTHTLEHIEPRFIDIALDSISRCSDKVYLEIPDVQGGIGHCNMKPLEEWQRDFEDRGYELAYIKPGPQILCMARKSGWRLRRTA